MALGKTVTQLQHTMPMTEFMSWQAFYEEMPFDHHHRFHRPAVLVSSCFAGGPAKDKFEFLVPTPAPEQFSNADMAMLAAFGNKPKAQI
ncbi:hypothetical protein [Orrella sp. 11846]|uniref:hypothetical protein n=1 Tax=Orrella sp. 11846 TaxID=3409913 RepID=UPI003B5AE53B